MPRKKSFYSAGFFPKRFINIAEAANAKHAMKIAQFLDWKVTVEDIYVRQVNGHEVEYVPVNCSQSKATVRRGDPYSKNDLDVYAVVTKQYEVLPNEKCAYSIDKITESFSAKYLHAREYSGGKTCITIESNQEWTEIPAKKWKLRGHIWNSFDGKKAFSGYFTIYDGNLGVYLFQAHEKFRVSHKATASKGAEEREMEFKKKVDLELKISIANVNERMGNLYDKSLMLASIDMSESDLGELLRNLFIRSDNQSDSVAARVEAQRKDVLDIFNNDASLEDYKNTAWAAYVALVLHLDRQLPQEKEPRDYLNTDWKAKDAAFKAITEFAQKSGKFN